MKTLIEFLIVFTLVASTQSFARVSDKHNEVVLAQQLKLWSEQISREGKNYLNVEKNYNEVFRALEKMVLMTVRKPDPSLIDALTVFAGEIAYADDSAWVGVWMLPLWKRHPEAVARAANKLPTRKRKELLRQIKVRLLEETEGNG